MRTIVIALSVVALANSAALAAPTKLGVGGERYDGHGKVVGSIKSPVQCVAVMHSRRFWCSSARRSLNAISPSQSMSA